MPLELECRVQSADETVDIGGLDEPYAAGQQSVGAHHLTMPRSAVTTSHRDSPCTRWVRSYPSPGLAVRPGVIARPAQAGVQQEARHHPQIQAGEEVPGTLAELG